MPQIQFDYDDQDRQFLERICQVKGFGSCDQAAEWLIKTRLRRATNKLTGRGRALYPVSR